MIKVNGKEFPFSGTLNDLLKKEGYDNVARLAVEINGAIVPKAEYDKKTLRDGDSVEIVCFVGGG